MRKTAVYLKTSEKNVVNIKVDWNDLKSIKSVEKQKTKLENNGYTLINTIAGFTTTTLIYKKNTK